MLKGKEPHVAGDVDRPAAVKTTLGKPSSSFSARSFNSSWPWVVASGSHQITSSVELAAIAFRRRSGPRSLKTAKRLMSSSSRIRALSETSASLLWWGHALILLPDG
jgi:hypothetical protein